MKELNRRQFFNLIVTGAAAFVGVTAASAAKSALAAVHDDTDSAPSLPEYNHENTVSESISPDVDSGSDLMLAQAGGSVRRTSRRTSRRTARRVTAVTSD
jgi:hypothetical protein